MGKKKNIAKETSPKTLPQASSAGLSKPIRLNEAWFVFLFGLLLYAQTLTYQYTLDDMLVITENKFTKAGFSGITKILTNDSFVGFFGENKNLLPGGRYRPLSQIMFAIEYAIFGLNPFIGHLLNIIFYALLGLILFLTLKKLFIHIKATSYWFHFPFWTSLLFIAHPIHTEVVANIKGRDEIICLLFCVLTWYFYLKYFDSNSKKYLWLAAVIFLFALLSKENAVTFFAVLPLSIYFFRERKIKDIIISSVPLLVSVIAFLSIRAYALGFITSSGVEETELLNNPYIGSTTAEKFATITYTFGKYIQLLLFPHPLTHDYYPKQIPIINWADIRAIIPFVINLGLVVFAILKLKARNLYAFAILYYFITFSVASNVAFNVGTFMNERFMFAPSLGFTMILSYCLLIDVPKKWNTATNNKNIIVAALFVILGLYAIKTVTRNPVWKDDFTLFTSDAMISTNSSKVNVSAGGELIKKAQAEKDTLKKMEYLNRAILHLSKGVTIYPKNIAGWLLYGSAYLYSEKWDEAITCYENCLRMTPDYPYALTNLTHLGQVTSKKGLYDYSFKAYRTLFKYKYKSALVYYEMGLVFDKVNQLDSALNYLKKSVEIDPKYYNAYIKLGEIYGRKIGDLKTSKEYLLKAYEIKPDEVPTLQNLGVAYGISGEYEKSIYYFEKALKIDSTNVELLTNLAGSYGNMGNKQKAAELLVKAQKITTKKSKNE